MFRVIWGGYKDGNKRNNHPTNLEYVTHKENVLHRGALGLTACGERHGRAKLNEYKVQKIRRLYSAHTHSQEKLATMFGVSQVLVGKITRGKIWRTLCSA